MHPSFPVPVPDQTKKVTSMKKHIIKYLHFALGCFIMALAINVFLVQHHFLSGGIAGLAMLIYYIAGFPMGVTSFLLNVPLFYMAYKFMSRKFLVDSLIGTALFSIFLDGTAFLSHTTYVTDPLLTCIPGGALEGIGAALVYRVDGSTGGVDILGFIAKKFYNIGISTTNFIFNAIVVTCALYFVGLEPVLYSLVLFFLCFKATNVAMVGFDYKKSVLIITQQPDTIRKLVISEVNRGITILKGAGGYTGKDKEILLVVVKIRQLGYLLKLIERVDPAAFVLVQDANDVFGRGFTQPDVYLPPAEGEKEKHA